MSVGMLALLTAINLINYLDRFVLAPLVPSVQKEFRINDAQAGMLQAAFIAVYMLVSLPVGILADRFTRKYLVGSGVLIWSFATLFSALAPSYHWLLFNRALVGIGEASYSCIAPVIISDLFPAQQRSRALAVFYSAIAVGTALGYMIGGIVGSRFGWRNAFFVGAVPGFVLSIGMLLAPEPRRGAADVRDARQRGAADADAPRRGAVDVRDAPQPGSADLPHAHAPDTHSLGAVLRALTGNRAYVYVTLGMAFTTFALGAFAFWTPAFLQHTRGLAQKSVGVIFGEFTLFNGIVATLLGGWIADRWLRRKPSALYDVSAWSMLLGTPVVVVGLFARTPAVFLPGIFFSEFFLFLNGGPMNAALVNSVSATIRARALAVNLIAIHLLGDVMSSPLVGLVSDHTHSLAVGMSVVLPVMVLSTVVLFRGGRYAPPA